VDEAGFEHLTGGYGSGCGGGNSQISLFDPATTFLEVSNMSATMARQGDWVQLEQSIIRLALNMPKMAKAGFLCTAMAEMEYWMMKCCTEVREERMRGVEFPGHRIVKAMIERHLAMVHQNQMDGCLPCQNGMAKNMQTRWRSKGTGALTPFRCRQPTPEPTPPAPGKPPPPSGDNAEA